MQVKQNRLTPQICPHCRFQFPSLSEMSKLLGTSLITSPWFRQHVSACRRKTKIEREYWKVVRDWPRPSLTKRLKRDGLSATLARRKVEG